MKVEVAVLGSPSLTVLMVSVDVKQHSFRAQELCEVAVLGSSSLIVLMVSVDMKHHERRCDLYRVAPRPRCVNILLNVHRSKDTY